MEVGVLSGAFALAFLVEGLVEYVLGIWWKPMSEATRKAVLPAIALVLGMGLALGFRIDLLALVGLNQPILGQILSGLMIGRGSEYLHRFVRDFLARK